ncbi:hypothetical protein GCK72_009081 [Caenorhabditis remanei]|uniref:PH domain-containing protein n=1 Tax=Caenorhabditis remanei TaxID=31234 RepID=A0A6A5H1D8_CAERE|nr:hypothetical protein GCK72_009081 [Caenorhabditis remanei]KAF1760831.1 hypothetical protein GCK72_009081 [Caenorhabditis remanei]
MGRKKGKSRQNQNRQNQSPMKAPTGFEDLGSPNLVEVKNSNFGDEVVIPANETSFDTRNQPKNAYKTVYLSGEDLSIGPAHSEKKFGSRGSNSSSYHNLIDGGAYNQFRHSRQSLNRSKIDFESAGDRVMAGSRSISHRSLFNDDRSFRNSKNPSKTSLAGSKVSIEWDDMGDNGQVHISRKSSNRDLMENGYDEATRRPFVRSRTVSSGGSNRQNNNLLPPMSTSHREIDAMNEDVRTYHAGSEYLQNHLSKLSLHSNNDEFVLIGGHPPPLSSSTNSLNRIHSAPVPRPRSRISSYSENVENGFEKIPSITTSQDDLGRSISQQSLTEIDNGHVSRASSRFSMGTNSNTDDRLILAARYSQSPEAEGLSSDDRSGFKLPRSRQSSVSRSIASDKGVGFVEIPTLYSHPDEKFDDNEPGEPFRPTSEHSCTPTSTTRTRSTLLRSDAQDGGFSSSSSSLSRHDDENQPQKALIVTSALTPVIPKRQPHRSASQSEESLVMKTPQTVQRAHEQKHIRSNIGENIRKTVEIAVQTGNSIRLRQNQHFGDVLSECAYLPEPNRFGMSPAKTASYIPQEEVIIPKNSAPEVPENSIRARLRHISDIYSNDGEGYTGRVETPILTSSVNQNSGFVHIPKAQPLKQIKPTYKKSTEEIVVPITMPTKNIQQPQRTVEIPKSTDLEKKKEEKSGDTIRKHIPRGRIRDLASAFDKMNDGAPVRPLEFKSQVHIPSAREENFWNMKKPVGGAGESNNDVRVSTPSIPLSGPLSGPLTGSSSSAFRSSTQTIRSQEDRRRSTSSSLHHQPLVFTRNTFLTSSVMKPGDKSNLPTNVAMTSNYSQDNVAKGDGFVSAFEKIPLQTSSTHLHSDENDRESRYTTSPRSVKTALSYKTLERASPTKDTTFSEYSRKVEVPVRLEVPIGGRNEKMRKQRLTANTRAKTQEIPPTGRTFEFESRYESRAVSGDLNEPNVFGMQKPLFAASREAFGRDTAEDLRGGKLESWQRQHQWTSDFQMSESKNTNSVTSPIYHQHYQTNSITPPMPYRNEHKTSEVSRNKTTSIPSTRHSMSRHPYSPPATEDAGSRITHHTSQTLQSDDLFATTENSSIRGKIDRMFDFVESDDSRKTLQAHESHASTDTIGTNGINHNQSNSKFREEKFYTPRQNWSDSTTKLLGGVNKAAEMPQALKARTESPKMKSPERRNTVTVPELEHFDNELEYSLSQYREIQREQLRRRLPSADEPQFFRSPMLSAPHAGQSMHAYRTKDLMGTPTAGEKFRFPSSSSNFKLPPVALATSTPVESPSGRHQTSSYSIKENYSHLELNNNTNSTNHLHRPNETFVSSISGVSAVDKHADVMRKINRLSYMIENTQKQMSMNEAALVDAVKRGRRSQEIASHRSILISRETLRLQRQELRRLHAFSAVRRPPPPVAKELRGAVIFKNLIVHLNKLFVSRLTIKDDNSYSFVALFKFGHQVEATELVPLRVFPGEETCDKLFFVKQIQFSDVPVDFVVSIEIYAMRVPSAKPAELSIGSSLANKCKSLMGPPQKKTTVPVETAFKFRGRLVLDRDASGERCLYLDDVTYPLEGTVMITTQCSRLPESFEIDFRGFLTMFHTISNMASWERYWAVLRRGVVFFWKYPDDEQMGREPKMQIDLTKCTNNSIEKCSADLCPRPDSFVIEILVDAEDGTIGSVVEKKRVLLSADSSDMLSQWLFTLNQTLDVIRGPI